MPGRQNVVTKETVDPEAPRPPRDPHVTYLGLNFPHGVTPGECQRIAAFAEKIVGARVSEGGYQPQGPFGLHVDPVTFSPDQYTFTFGYKDSK